MKVEFPLSEGERRVALIAGARESWEKLEGQDLGTLPPALFEQDAASAMAFGRVQERVLQGKIYDFDGKTLERLGRVNERLAASGRPPVQLKKLTEEVEALSNDPSLSNREKKKAIEELRRKLGLKRKEFKNLVVSRLKRIYGEQASVMASYRRELVTRLTREVTLAESLYGPRSVAAAVARKRLRGVEEALQPFEMRFRTARAFYKGLYPSFWSRLGGFFKKVFVRVLRSLVRWFPPIMLHSVPGLGTALGIIFPLAKKPIQLVRNIAKVVDDVIKTVRETYRELKRDFSENS